ncbi:MAG TPA: hypothetical protein PLR07_01710, partial [Promineifilum sp.]|nr:hypothetical protein [Promineifilum sp.]
MLNDIRTFLEDFSRRLLTVDSLLQVGLFAGILLIALATRNLLRRQVERVEARLRQVGIVAEQFPWSVDLLVALGASIFPLVVWLLCTIAAGVLGSVERPADVLAWLAPIFGLVGVYRF